MIQLTQVVRDLLQSALADGAVCLVGTATRDGYPQISPKGSVVVFDDDTLCYWERSKRSSSRRVLENPHVCIFYRNVAKAGKDFRGGAIRFYGEATVLTDGAARDRVWELIPDAERKPDPEKQGYAVLVKLTSVEDLSGSALMKRD